MAVTAVVVEATEVVMAVVEVVVEDGVTATKCLTSVVVFVTLTGIPPSLSILRKTSMSKISVSPLAAIGRLRNSGKTKR